MSGGSFNYAYSRVEVFADDLENLVSQKDQFDQEVQVRMQQIIELARSAARAMKEVEWYVSCDTSEHTFLSRTAAEFKEPTSMKFGETDIYLSYEDSRYPTLVVAGIPYITGFALDPTTGSLRQVCVCAASGDSECICTYTAVRGEY